MRKKKVSKKPLKKPAKKVPAKSQRKPKKKVTLKLWKQLPNSFNYEYLGAKKGCKFLCRAKRQMTEDQLDENLVAAMILNPGKLQPGASLTFDALDDPTQTLVQMLRNPSDEWRLNYLKMLAEQSNGQVSFISGGPGPIMPSGPKKKPQKGNCPQCHGKGWVCEDHPRVAWEDKIDGECPCGAPEAPCDTCNRNATIVLGPGDYSFGRCCHRCEDQRWLCPKHKKPWKLAGTGCDCGPGKPCPDCNPDGRMELGTFKVIRSGFN